MSHAKLPGDKVRQACERVLASGQYIAAEGTQLRQMIGLSKCSKSDVYVSLELWGIIEEVY